MSPEQAAGDGHLDGRSDIYSPGCVLYEMLAGQPPFTGPTSQAIMARHAMDPVAPLRTVRRSIPVGMERAVLRALEKVPADRFATAEQFSRALTAGERAPRWARAHPFSRRTAGVIAVVVANIALAIGVFFSRHSPRAAGGVDPGLVAVLPFRVAGAAPAWGTLRRGSWISWREADRRGRSKGPRSQGPAESLAPRASLWGQRPLA